MFIESLYSVYFYVFHVLPFGIINDDDDDDDNQALSMNQRCGQSPGGRTEYVNELGSEVRLEVALETV